MNLFKWEHHSFPSIAVAIMLFSAHKKNAKIGNGDKKKIKIK